MNKYQYTYLHLLKIIQYYTIPTITNLINLSYGALCRGNIDTLDHEMFTDPTHRYIIAISKHFSGRNFSPTLLKFSTLFLFYKPLDKVTKQKELVCKLKNGG